MAQIPKGRLVKGPYTPICRDCAIYFVNYCKDLMTMMIDFWKVNIIDYYD